MIGPRMQPERLCFCPIEQDRMSCITAWLPCPSRDPY